MANQHRLASQPAQPLHYVLRVGHAAAEQQQLGLRRRQSYRQLVIQTPVQVAEHLVLVHHQRAGPSPRIRRFFCVSSVATSTGAPRFSARSPVAMPTSQPRPRHSASLSLASARVGTV